MKYLVIGEAIDYSMTPGELITYIEQSVVPSLESMANMENDKIITGGGIYAGGRIGVAIFEAKSNEELSKYLQSFPFWGNMKWTVTPLDSYPERLKQTKANLDKLRSMQK